MQRRPKKALQSEEMIIPIYTAFALLGTALASVVVAQQGLNQRWPRNIALTVAPLCFAAAYLGAHLFYAFTRFDLPATQWWPMLFNIGYGAVWFGGAMTAVIFLWLYSKRVHIPSFQLFDTFALAAPVLQAIGRIGCFFEGCCYGRPTTLPWGATVNTPEFGLRPLHPVQIYESIYLAIIFAFLWFTRARLHKPWQRTGAYLCTAGVGRFALEFFRGDLVRGGISLTASLRVSTSQVLGLAAITAGLALLIRAERHRVQTDRVAR